MLSMYKIQIPDGIVESIHYLMYFPDDRPPNVHIQSLPRSTSPNQILLDVKRRTTYRYILTLSHQLKAFFKPVKPFLQFLTHFHTCESKLFQDLMKEELKQHSSIAIEELATVLDSVRIKLQSILDGTIACEEVAIFLGSIQEKGITREVKVLTEFRAFKESSLKLTEIQLKNVLIFHQIIGNIDSFCLFCTEFDLKQCLQDSRVIRLKEIVQNKEHLLKKNILTVSEVVDEIYSIFGIKESTKASQFQFLQLFKHLHMDTKELRIFLTENNFRGKGQNRFQQLHTIVTQGLQHEEYNADILTKLYAVYYTLVPLNNPDLSFKELVDTVSQIKASTCLAELRTVNSNIDLIRMWFSKAEVCI